MRLNVLLMVLALASLTFVLALMLGTYFTLESIRNF